MVVAFMFFLVSISKYVSYYSFRVSESAARERKAIKHKLEQIDPSPTEEVPGFSNTPLSGSPKKRQQPATYVQVRISCDPFSFLLCYSVLLRPMLWMHWTDDVGLYLLCSLVTNALPHNVVFYTF